MDRKRARWLSPAKLNLALSVGGIRGDGFHEIRTLLQAIDLADVLEFEAMPDPGIEICCDRADVPLDGTNLVVRAYELLAHRRAPNSGYRVMIRKRIPPGSGLGGGSSNAAAALSAFDEMEGLGLDEGALESLAAELGSDTAFFVRGGTQLGSGRGEHLSAAPPLRRGCFLVVLSGIHVSTAAVYARGGFDLTPEPDPLTILGLELTREDPEGVARGLFNALEGPAFSLHPALTRLKGQLLGTGALGALMSGSGSAVFGYYAEAETAAAAARSFTGTARAVVAHPIETGVRRLA